MEKNSLFKKIGKQILSINNLIESYFNKLRFFILNIKKSKISGHNRVFFILIGVVFLTLTYFLIPTSYDKNKINKDIKNQILLKYQINLEFNNDINYGLFPKPHFTIKNLSISNNSRKIAKIQSLKIFIGVKNFFKFSKMEIKDLILNKAEFNIQKKDLVFFANILKAEPSRQNLVIKNSNIFFKDENGEVLFINQIIDSKFYYDFKNLKNVFESKNKIFNLPYKLKIKNDKLNQILDTEIDCNKLRLKAENQIDYKDNDKIGILKINFKNKNNTLNYKLKKNSLNYSLKDSNKIFNGVVEFKPFYSLSNLEYQSFKLKDLINNPLINEMIKTDLIKNDNLNSKINFSINKITDFDRFKNLSLKSNIEEGVLSFSGSKVKWKDNLSLILEEGFIDHDDNSIIFNGKMVIDITDENDFFKFFQIRKNFRKKLKKVEFDFNFDLVEKKITFDNFKIDEQSNIKLDTFILNYNSKDEKFFNKITFKSFVSEVLKAYFG